jgi:nucleotide-binding universal stress UspA family protein
MSTPVGSQVGTQLQAGESLSKTSQAGFHNILLATDFSEASLATVPYLRALAAAEGAEAHLVHVAGSGISPLLPPEEQARILRDAEQGMRIFFERAAELTAGGALALRQIVKVGEASEVVRKLGRELGIDLVVLGTNGRRGLKRFMLGSVAEEIFRFVPWPVLTVGPKARSAGSHIPMGRLLFATDFAPTSLVALPRAVAIARERRAELTLLTVVRSKAKVAEAEARLRAPLSKEQAAGVTIRYEVGVGAPATAILKAAEEGRTDLIILGVRGGGEWDRAMTHAPGPVAYNVIARASCPGLTIRAREESGANGTAAQ